MAELEASSSEITKALGDRSTRLANISFWAKVATAGGALGITLNKAFEAGLAALGVKVTTAAAAGSGLLYVSGTVVFIAAIVVLVADDSASKLLAKARIALDLALAQKGESENQARHFDRLENLYRAEMDRLSHFQAARELVREIFEDVAVKGAKDEIEVIRRMLLQARRQLFLAHGFEMNDYFTLCVYERVVNPDSTKAELHCRAHIRAIDCELGDARIWKEGIGTPGIALARKEEVIIADLLEPGIAALYAPQDKKPNDKERYRSVVAEPIALDGGEPWGVLVASSSVPKHFSPEDRSYVDVAQSVAGMISLAIKLARVKRPNVQVVAAE